MTNLLALRFYERVRKQYQLRAEKRGVLTFGPVELRAGDLFGFRRQERVLEQTRRDRRLPAGRAGHCAGPASQLPLWR